MDGIALGPLAGFAAAALYTPGPNNLMLASSGARFGFLRTVPHLLGVATGFPLMLIAVGAGLGAVFQAFPALNMILRWLGAAIMLWLAWRIGTADTMGERAGGARPFRYWQAAAFQWINPKSWSMAIGVAGVHLSAVSPLRDAVVCAGVFLVIGLGSASIWTSFGAALRRALRRPGALRAFNAAMGLLLAGFVVWMVWHG